MVDRLVMHPRLGLNPRPCFCPACSGPSNNPTHVDIGNRNAVWTCSTCQSMRYGLTEPLVIGVDPTVAAAKDCTKCKAVQPGIIRPLIEGERVPGALCDDCADDDSALQARLAAGGVMFRCTACKTTGALAVDDAVAVAARTFQERPAPEPCGVEFDADNCPICKIARETGRSVADLITNPEKLVH